MRYSRSLCRISSIFSSSLTVSYTHLVDPVIAKDMEETEEIAAIVTAMVEQRNALGLSQRDLAAMCGIPQSLSLIHISCFVINNFKKMLKI